MEITVTDAAREEIVTLIEKQDSTLTGVRIAADATSPMKANYRLAFIGEGQESEEDTVLPFDGFNIYVDPESVDFVQDITMDFVDGLMGRGFKIENPHKVPPHLKGTLAEKIQTIIDDQINPSIAAHGGRVALMDIQDKKVYLQFGGGCQGCGMVDVTLKQGVEVTIKEALPEIEAVLDITEHEKGENPYYKS